MSLSDSITALVCFSEYNLFSMLKRFEINVFFLLFDALSELFLDLRKVIVVVFMFGLEDLNLVLS